MRQVRYDPALETPSGIGNVTRLRAIGQDRRVDTTVLTTKFVLERVLARIFKSPQASRFILKGGLLIHYAEETDTIGGRETRDIDLHCFEGSIDELNEIIREVLCAPQEVDDGIRFDIASLRIARERNGPVPGGKISIQAQIARTRVNVAIDFGIDQRPIHELSVMRAYRSVLPKMFDPVDIRCTPFEYTVADKIHAMHRHGSDNSRIRDYYDLWLLLKDGEMEAPAVADALRRTFDTWEHALPQIDEVFGLSPDYAARHASTWDAMRKGFFKHPPELDEVVAVIREQVEPAFALAHAQPAAPK